MPGIYSITNTVSGKVYIGSTVDFDTRWAYHRSRLRCNKHDNSYLQRSWDKYGECAFEFSILECLDDFEKLIEVEQFWMDAYREEGRELYNIGKCAYSARRGVQCSEEHKKKIGKANRGNQNTLGHILSKEHKCRIGEANMGHKHSKEARQRMSENGRGESSGVNKLTKNQVLWVRALAKEGMLQKNIGKLLGVSESAISMIVHRKQWGWLPG